MLENQLLKEEIEMWKQQVIDKEDQLWDLELEKSYITSVKHELTGATGDS